MIKSYIYLSIYLSTLIKRAKIIYIYIYLFVSCVYFENGSTDFDETNYEQVLRMRKRSR